MARMAASHRPTAGFSDVSNFGFDFDVRQAVRLLSEPASQIARVTNAVGQQKAA